MTAWYEPWFSCEDTASVSLNLCHYTAEYQRHTPAFFPKETSQLYSLHSKEKRRDSNPATRKHKLDIIITPQYSHKKDKLRIYFVLWGFNFFLQIIRVQTYVQITASSDRHLESCRFHFFQSVCLTVCLSVSACKIFHTLKFQFHRTALRSKGAKGS